MEEIDNRKVATGAERQLKYKENNEAKVKLNQLKQNIARATLKESNPSKAEAVKEANKKRKAAQRRKKKEMDENKENETSSPNTNKSKNDETPRRGHRRSSGEQSDVSLEIEDQGSFHETFATPTSSRQSMIGLKLRKKDAKSKQKKIYEVLQENAELKRVQNRHDDLVTELDFKITELKIQEKSKQRIKKLETEKLENKDKWFGQLYKNIKPESKRDVRNTFSVVAPQMEKGTISRLRKNTGINFSIPTANSKDETTELKKYIINFAEENTIPVPDKKKYMRGIRFRMATKLSLFNTFETQHPNVCSYQTFCQYWPSLYIKPCPSEFGTCLCTTCQNIELKILALQHRKLCDPFHCLESITEDLRKDNFERENMFKDEIAALDSDEKKDIDVGYQQWEKVKQSEISKNTGKVKGDKTMRLSKHLSAAELGKEILEEYEAYKSHMDRHFIITKERKNSRMEAMDEADLAVLHVDWAEQHKLTEIKEIQTAYFNGRYCYDIHTGYCYTKEDCHGFASLSDCSDHRAEAICCAIRSKIVNLVEKGKTRFVICSDSPTSQYRNSKNVFLMKRLAQELNISIRLLFTEAGHGKSPCDGVGGNIKTQVEQAALTNFGEGVVEPIHSVEDVKKVIKEKTNLTYDISIHTKEEIEMVKESMPKLGPLVGAMKIHEILITPDGDVKKKDLPTDPFYKSVNIKESRTRPMMTEQSEADQMLSESEPESDYELELEDLNNAFYIYK